MYVELQTIIKDLTKERIIYWLIQWKGKQVENSQ